MSAVKFPGDLAKLPFLPGYTFSDPTKSRYHKCQSLDYKNGYIFPRVGFNDHKSMGYLPEHQLIDNPCLPTALIYGPKREAPDRFVPAVVALEKKILRFYGYLKESVLDNPDEVYRVRPMTIYYYLIDDTIMIMEPHIENSGLMQGKFLKRQRIPKNIQGDYITWKDLNVGMNLNVYGKAIRLADCDRWTAEFLMSEGIDLNSVEHIPADPSTEKRIADRPTTLVITANSDDKLRKFLQNDRKVLRFNCVWDNRDSLYGEMKPYIFLFFLADDTIEIREIRSPNDGCDPFPVFMRRHRVPKDIEAVEKDFPSIVLEPLEKDVNGFYSPADLCIGKVLNIYGRKILLYDCDKFTQDYYASHYGITDFTPVEIDLPLKKKLKPKLAPPNLWGTPEDSLQSCLKVVPERPIKNINFMLEKQNIVLRFEAIMDSVHEIDWGRRFIINFFVADQTISVFEPPLTNTGFRGGKFLKRTRVKKPGGDPYNPEYYGAPDLERGAVIEIFKHRFVIVDEELFTKKYKQKFPEEFKSQQEKEKPYVLSDVESNICDGKRENLSNINKEDNPGTMVCNRPQENIENTKRETLEADAYDDKQENIDSCDYDMGSGDGRGRISC